MAIFVVRYQRSSAYATPWVIILLIAPAAGVILYILWGRQSIFKESRRVLKNYLESENYSQDSIDSLSQLPGLRQIPYYSAPNIAIKTQRVAPAAKLREFKSEENLPAAYYRLPLAARFLINWGYPLYQGNELEYFSTGQSQFEQMFADLRQAKKFIFAEYYIVNEGRIWDEFTSILCERRADGVEVRLLIDDFACAGRISRLMLEPLEAAGITILRFNPILRYTSRMYINYRNHQKICLIDGDIAYYSGTNLADEYANIYQPFGYWKDNALKVRGAAAWEGLRQFLMMWHLAGGSSPQDMLKYQPSAKFPLRLAAWDSLLESKVIDKHGRLTKTGQDYLEELYGKEYSDSAEARRIAKPNSFVIPFWDGPVNNPHNIVEDLYLAMINGAKKNIYISTPYLIIDEKFTRALARSASSGIDVRIICPGIPDKKTVNQTTKSNYEPLLRAGVRVYEYSPGFNHEKTLIVDSKEAVTGSINFDYRSFNLNYENGIFIYDTELVVNMTEDFLKSVTKSKEIKLKEWLKRPIYQKFIQEFLRIFAPLA